MKLKFALNIFVICMLIGISIATTYIYFIKGQIIAYGDAESHLNIAKRIVDSITPGLAQLGGIWLPLPHLFLMPLTKIDILYTTGLAGSIVSGILFVASGFAIYKTITLLTQNKIAAFLGLLVFALNANILYLQTTAMTEIPLLAFFVFSIYFFIDYLKADKKVLSLVFAAFFGLCATLSRYDGWFLVLVEGFILILHGALNKYSFKKIEGLVILFSTLAFIGILGWFLWDYLILHDPMYFTNSPFSAKSQQQSWLERGELPSYKSIVSAFSYYGYTTYLNVGKYISLFTLFSMWLLVVYNKIKERFYLILLLFSPFIFNVLTLYLGQSIIFVPGLTPNNFEWNLFNVRYGVMMIPGVAILSALFVSQIYDSLKNLKYIKYFSFMPLILVIFLQSYSFAGGFETIISLDDAMYGLSSSKKSDAQNWLKQNYDNGLVLLDDYARSVSIISSGLPMKNVIYIGNKPYWEESLQEPEKYAKWIVMQKSDDVWRHLYEDPNMLARVYKYFEKAYTSPNIIIFKKIEEKNDIACVITQQSSVNSQ